VHCPEETTNKALAKTYEYMVKHTNIQDQQERYDTFYKVLSYLERKFVFTVYENMFLNEREIRETIASAAIILPKRFCERLSLIPRDAIIHTSQNNWTAINYWYKSIIGAVMAMMQPCPGQDFASLD
jgi:hypothetical protein